MGTVWDALRNRKICLPGEGDPPLLAFIKFSDFETASNLFPPEAENSSKLERGREFNFVSFLSLSSWP